MNSPHRILYLYSTPACHLCETARDLVDPYLDELEITLVAVDISESDALVDAYGIRIPVLRFADGEKDLGWPFTAGDFLNFAGQANF